MGHGGRIYIWFGVRGLGGIGRLWGLDRQCPPFENREGLGKQVMNSGKKGGPAPNRPPA